MSINKLALIRYKTIDACLSNRYRKWTLDDLIIKVADRLYEYEGITSGISRRTIQADIQVMRSDKLGYNAPIVVLEKKFYTYSDPKYSITNVPINNTDVEKMKEVVGILKQFNGFTYFDEMSDLIARLENKVNRTVRQGPDCIQFESNHLLRGIGHVNPLYQAILNKRSLLIEYKSFNAPESQQYICYPYLLKEFRNRWWLIAEAKKSKQLMTLALDRIVEFQELVHEKYLESTIDFDEYFKSTIGVTRNETDRPVKVILFVQKKHAPYILTKPLHHSQQLLKENEEGIEISIEVILNFELEREILGYGEYVKVLLPRNLAGRIRKRWENGLVMYGK